MVAAKRGSEQRISVCWKYFSEVGLHFSFTLLAVAFTGNCGVLLCSESPATSMGGLPPRLKLVKGRLKPATMGGFKTSHFEER